MIPIRIQKVSRTRTGGNLGNGLAPEKDRQLGVPRANAKELYNSIVHGLNLAHYATTCVNLALMGEVLLSMIMH